MENSKEKLQRTVVIEWITILTAVLACFGVLYAEIKGLDGKLERSTAAQIARTDKLYEMFIDLLKETKCPQKVETKS